MVDLDLLELQEESLNDSLDALFDELEDINYELDLYEEDYMEDLITRKSEIQKQIKYIQKTLKSINEHDEF